MELWDRKNGGLCFVDPDGWLCKGIVRDRNWEEVACEQRKQSVKKILPRKITLFTLNHDAFSVVVKDWVCCRCGYQNRYTGEAHGIYPAAKFRAFTVELLYFWMHQCMGRGMSFRSVFELTADLQNTSSYRRKFEIRRLDVLAADFKRDRRLANAAIRKFCYHIDLQDSSFCTRDLFSCRKCEVPLNADDCKQLGVVQEHAKGMKRFHSVVMDGKVIGALRDFPVNGSDVQSLVGTKWLMSKIVSKRDRRLALKVFTQGVRRKVRAVEYGRGSDVRNDISYKHGKVYFRLGSLLELKGITKANYEHTMKIVRWFCDRKSCLCRGSRWMDSLDHTECQKERVVLESQKGCAITCRLLSIVFGVGGDGSGGSTVECTRETRSGRETRLHDRVDVLREHPGRVSDGEESGSDESEEAHNSDDGAEGSAERCPIDLKNQWVFFRIEDSFRCTEVLEALMENIQFALGEPITLGFLPYFTHSEGTSDGVSNPDNRCSEPDNEDQRRPSADGIVLDEWGKQYMEVLRKDGDGPEGTFRNVGRRRKQAIDLLTVETEELHRNASKALRMFSTCDHNGASLSSFPCLQFCNAIECYGKLLEQQNTVVATLLNEVIRAGRRAPVLSRKACQIVHELIDTKLGAFAAYKADAASKIHATVCKYWERYGHFNVNGMKDGTEEDSRFVFPGRSRLRPAIKTDGKDKAECTKKYYTSRPNMTSFISIQCA